MAAGSQIPARYELKYLVPECLVPELRSALAPYCALDRHSAAAPDRQYVIHSLYLDTASRDLYRISREGRAHRFKVRIRRYASRQPTFFEVKRKLGQVVVKSRAAVQGDFLSRLRGPPAPDASAAELDFRMRVDGYALLPALLVRYEREAWTGTVDAYARVTFDRRIVCQPVAGFDLVGDPCAWLSLDERPSPRRAAQAVLLELKATLDVPRWMESLAHRLELRRSGFSKYCNGIERWAKAALPAREARAAACFP